MPKKFIEVHVLQWFPLSCVNRDDAGLPKSMSLGGERRARWSSQSQKYALRKAFKGHLFDNNLCVKTRRLPILAMGVLTGRGRDEAEAARRVAAAVLALGLKLNPSKEGAAAAVDADQPTEEPEEDVAAFGRYLTGRTQVILPVPQTAAASLADAVEAHWDALGEAVDLTKNFKGMAKDSKGKSVIPSATVKAVTPAAARALDAERLVDVSLFGRMLTEVPTESVDGTCSVAHAFTTHPDDYESEFWSAVDDDQGNQGHGGSAHMGVQGLTSGCFYRYGVVDVDALREGSLTGEEALVESGVREFVRGFATLRPRAMVHGTAPYVDPALVVAAVTDSPRMLGDAFVRPVEDGDYLASSAERLAETWAASARAFRRQATAFVLSGHPDIADVTFDGSQAMFDIDVLVDSASRAALDV